MNTKTKNQHAKTFHCVHCGSSIDIDSLSEIVTCSHCAHIQRVDRALIDELREYEAAVGSDLDSARMAREQAATWKRTAEQVKRSTRPGSYILAIAVIAGVPMATFFIGMALMKAGVIPKDRMDIVGISTQVSAFIGIGAYYAIYLLRRKRLNIKATSVSSSNIRCPDCGALNELTEGEAVETCKYCDASLIPTKDVREQAADAAAKERRRALMEKYRAERSGYNAYKKVGLSTTAMTIFIGGSFLFMIGGGAVAFSVQMATGEEPYSPAIFGMWAATIAIVAAMVSVIKFTKWKTRVFAEATGSLAESFGGELLNADSGSTNWLNTYWAGPIDPMEMFPGKYYQSASIKIRGFELFFDVNAIPPSDKHRAYSRIIVPCDPPITEEPQLPKEANSNMKQCTSLGFMPEIKPGGLIARADHALLKKLRKPENIAQLAKPITAMVKLAESLEAPPTGPVP